jgi:hypothetical protein
MLVVGLITGVALVIGGLFATTNPNINVFAQAPDADSAVEPDAPLAISQVLSYQGRLLTPSTGDPKPDGVYQMTFSIYNVLTGGAALWTETKSVTVGNGTFTSLLGDTTPLILSNFNGQELFLGIKVGDDAEATPRQRMAHTAYAMRAEVAGDSSNANRLDGIDSTAFLLATGPDTMAGNNTAPILQVTQSGAGNAIMGVTSSTDPGDAAIYGETASISGAGIPNEPAGVMGRSADNFGVVGMSNTDDGVYGRSNTEYGVRAESAGARAAIFALASGGTSTSYGIYADGFNYGLFSPDPINVGTAQNDIAEHMPAAAGIEAGDVVVIDPNHDERVIKSYKANDTAVAGVISTEPAMLIGGSESKTPLALAGRVPVKVSAENGPIRRGDLLTTSDTPGHAMRATPIEVNGVEFYAPGTIIGKAMGELSEGTGTVIVLILPQ